MWKTERCSLPSLTDEINDLKNVFRKLLTKELFGDKMSYAKTEYIRGAFC